MAHCPLETEHIKPNYQAGAALKILKKGLMHWSCQTPWGIWVKSFVDLRLEKEDQRPAAVVEVCLRPAGMN